MPGSRLPVPNLQNFRLTLAYDGRAYYGWQRHGDSPTIQGAVERALSDVFATEIEIRGAGRTDRGAHAKGQVASAQLPTEAQGDGALAVINNALPSDIQLLDVAPVADDFHARHSAVAKRYRYVIFNAKQCPAKLKGLVWHIPGALDVEAMRAALPLFVGTIDFASFATKPNHKRATTVRTVTEFEMKGAAPTIELSIRADGFLYKMVRNVVRAIVKVGEGRTPLADLQRIVDARDRKAAPGTAPASGLFLDEVVYAVPDA